MPFIFAGIVKVIRHVFQICHSDLFFRYVSAMKFLAFGMWCFVEHFGIAVINAVVNPFINPGALLLCKIRLERLSVQTRWSKSY